MNYFIYLLFFLTSYALMAGVSFTAPAQPTKNVDVAALLQVPKSADDIRGISARITVEGAAVRPFNLVFGAVAEKVLADEAKTKLSAIVERDFAITGAVNLMRGIEQSAELLKQKGAEGKALVKIGLDGTNVKAVVECHNLISGRTFAKTLVGHDQRKLAHLVAQTIFEHFIGPENLFELKIAAIKRKGSESQVVLLDFDGMNETPLTSGSWLKSSPHFAPDGKSILYSVVANEGQGIVEQVIGVSHFKFLTREPGLNLDPRVHQSTVFATLSFGRNANIYKMNRDGKVPQKITDGIGLNLSPAISPDGNELAFVSDRSGSPQIYVMPTNGGKAERLTFHGKYNQTPQYNHKGDLIAFTGRDEQEVFDIFVIERKTGRISRVTEHQGRNQEPDFSPSGRFIIFSSSRSGQGQQIYISNLNGNHQYQLTPKDAGYYSPVMQRKYSALH